MTDSEHDHFIETGEVTGYTPKPPRPGPKRKKRLVKTPGELLLTRRLPLLAIQVDIAVSSSKSLLCRNYLIVTKDESDVSTSEPCPTEENGDLDNTNLHTLTQFRRLIQKGRPLRQAENKPRIPNDASLNWIDEDLLLARTIKRGVSMDGKDGKHLALVSEFTNLWRSLLNIRRQRAHLLQPQKLLYLLIQL